MQGATARHGALHTPHTHPLQQLRCPLHHQQQQGVHALPCSCTSPAAAGKRRGLASLVCRAQGLWSRAPDDWDLQQEEEEMMRRQQRQQADAARSAALEAGWRAQVDAAHQQLLDQQKHRAALRERLQQDAQRAKQEQLRRIAPVAKARARAQGLGSLGYDPDILALSEKFGRMSHLVDEVQRRMEAQYGSMAAPVPQVPQQQRLQPQQQQQQQWQQAPPPRMPPQPGYGQTVAPQPAARWPAGSAVPQVPQQQQLPRVASQPPLQQQPWQAPPSQPEQPPRWQQQQQPRPMER